MKSILTTIAGSAASLQAVSQSAESPGSILNDPLLPMYITAGAMLLLLILVAIVAIHVIRVLQILAEEASRQNALKAGVKYTAPQSAWQRFLNKMNASVPVEREKDIELDHSYDGIRELDNHLPPWWKALFYGSIGFAFVYFAVYHITGTLPLSEDEYKHELALADEQIRKHRASQPQAILDENNLEYTADAAAIEKGKAIFMNNNCGGCHRSDGGGNTIGPNLTDKYWLHGGDIKNIFATIKNGVVEKGMPAWGKSMSPQDVKDVTFFVMSLQGTNPPDGKVPQGEIFSEAKTTSDTVKTKAGL